MSEANERSVASNGSVAGEPVAWAALRDDGDIAWIGYTPEGAADGACGRRIVPLYRQPPCQDFSQKNLTFTEAETLRELRDEAAQYADEIGLSSSEVLARQRIIDGLLERLK